MYLFPSEEWIRAFVEELHKSEIYAAVAKDWEADLYYVVEADGALKETVYLYADMYHGKCREARIVRDPAEKNPTFTITAPLRVWRKIQQQELHPIVALVRRQLHVDGNMLKLIQNTKRTHEFFECATRVPTYYPE